VVFVAISSVVTNIVDTGVAFGYSALMKHRGKAAHVVTTERIYKDRVYRAHLLRRSYREDGKVKNQTLANLSHLPEHVVELIRRSLKGECFVSTDDAFERVDSWHHGHVDAVLSAMKRLGFEQLIASRRSRNRDIVLAMVVGRILEPDNEQNSKLANTRWWNITTLPQILDLQDVDEDDLYDAMDWLLGRQDTIEKNLAGRHLKEDGLVLYDLTSSYFEGVTCPLAKLGHNRDGKKGKLQVNYGLLTDSLGCPVAVSVFEGNRSDGKTLMPQVEKMRDSFGIQSMVLVGDRGMISQKLIDEELRGQEGIDWITALKSGQICKLVDDGHLQLGLFDERNLFEVIVPDYPGERLVACRNPALAKLRARKRQSLLEATVQVLEKARATVERGKLRGAEKIRRRAENIVKRYKVAKYFVFSISDDGFDFNVADKGQAAAAALESIQREVENVRSLIKRGRLVGKSKISDRINKILHKYRVAKYVSTDIGTDGFDYRIEDRETASEAALESVCEELRKVCFFVERGKFGGQDAIGVRVGKVIDKYKVAKHFILDIRDDGFDFHIDNEKVVTEAALDGIYVVRTSTSAGRLSAENTVRGYKRLSQVERAFRSLKTVDLKVRPIRHRLEIRVRSHIFLCMLAYYVEWHMREAWRPLLFADEDQLAKNQRDPVAPAKRSDGAIRKVKSKVLDDGSEVHSFQTLLKLLSQIVRNVCRVPGAGDDAPTFEIVTTPNAKQRRARKLLETIRV
jgi:transposase